MLLHIRRRQEKISALPQADKKLLRWVVLCMLVLTGTGTLMMTGGFAAADEWQVELLLGRPFYMEAEDVQVSLQIGRAHV